jgi:hypothetical protein
MKTRTRELAKPGIYGSTDNPIVVTERELREIAETFPDIRKAPISLNGHWPDPAKPRMGNVVAVTWDETSKVLSGTIEEQDTLADAVDQGYFPDCSIGAKRRAQDGRMYLHHLAYLGEEPPAIKDLVEGIEQSLSGPALAASDAAGIVLLPSARAVRLNLSDQAIINPNTPRVAGSAGESGLAGDNPEPKEGPMRTLEQAEADLAAEKARTTASGEEVGKLKQQLAGLAEKYPDAGIALSDTDPRVGVLMKQLRDGKKAEVMKAAAGKLPKGKEPLLVALSDSLSASAAIELSDGEAGAKRSLSQLDLLVSLLEAVPSPVAEGRLSLSDAGGESQAAPLDLSKIMTRV